MMRTARYPSSGRGSAPWMHTPPPLGRPSGWRLPPDADSVTCDACWEANSHTVNRMTDMCKNITFPQTSFVGSNNTILDNTMFEWYFAELGASVYSTLKISMLTIVRNL